MNENVEVLDEDFMPVDSSTNTNNSNTITQPINNGDVINLDRLFSDEEEDVVDAYEYDKKLEEIKQKKITRIQVILILVLLVLATITYFFGYDLFEPYIKID